jgi:hypothetical protein
MELHPWGTVFSHTMIVLLLQSYPDVWLFARFSVTGTDHSCPASYGLVSVTTPARREAEAQADEEDALEVAHS